MGFTQILIRSNVSCTTNVYTLYNNTDMEMIFNFFFVVQKMLPFFFYSRQRCYTKCVHIYVVQ
jgi:hypothetical protein